MKPILQALVLAERIYTDKSEKKIIVGTFNGYTIAKHTPKTNVQPDGSKTQSIPVGTDPGCPSLYISLTDVLDGTEIEVQFLNQSDNAVIFRTKYKIQSADRLQTIEIIAQLPSLVRFLKESGVYAFDVLWEGEILGSHRLNVTVTEEPLSA